MKKSHSELKDLAGTGNGTLKLSSCGNSLPYLSKKNSSVTHSSGILENSSSWFTHGGGDRLCGARFLETQLKAKFSWVIGGNRDGGDQSVGIIFGRQLGWQIEQLFIKRQLWVWVIHELESDTNGQDAYKRPWNHGKSVGGLTKLSWGQHSFLKAVVGMVEMEGAALQQQ